MNLDLEDLYDRGFYRNLFKEEDSLGQKIAVGDILVVKDEDEFKESAHVTFIYKGEWIVHPLFDLNIHAYEGLNGIKYAERDGGAGYLTLKTFMEDNEVKEFGNIFDIHQFAEYIVKNDDYEVFNEGDLYK
ncbi:Uncharacterised protein [Aerococcus viridans]|uniref:YopX protein domain-containing protein n=2 Tax=Aerococcus viridans TaxID=1377 RepID=A0AAU8U3C0_9LACT|nr:hypothetical protein [Aerococcus viridans]AMC00343.1 hypothetical protein AWM76_01505 [Aerococcus viridans]EFG49863.1 hypothetical protein HMPREF0061_0789 [Aerococcus viridans ATCC 11563 = CCUG 4311]SUU09263.1 Uncharacterised protein [Aerococcus viridans]